MDWAEMKLGGGCEVLLVLGDDPGGWTCPMFIEPQNTVGL